MSRRFRQRIEECFGWASTIGGLRKGRFTGRGKLGFQCMLTLSAWSLVRTRNLGRCVEVLLSRDWFVWLADSRAGCMTSGYVCRDNGLKVSLSRWIRFKGGYFQQPVRSGKTGSGPERSMNTGCVYTSGAGWWSGTLPGSSGNIASWFVGNISPGILSAPCRMQVSPSCSGSRQ